MILLLDEDRRFRSGVADYLRECGHRVAEFDSPEQFEPLEDLGSVRAVVLDSDADGCDGLRLADRFHERYPDAPVVIATTHRDLASQPDVHSRDFLYCFCKPLTSAALSRVVDVLLPTTVAK